MPTDWVYDFDCDYLWIWLKEPVCTKIKMKTSHEYCDFCVRNRYRDRPLKLKENDDA